MLDFKGKGRRRGRKQNTTHEVEEGDWGPGDKGRTMLCGLAFSLLGDVRFLGKFEVAE